MASFTPYFINTVNRAKWSTGATIVGTAVSKAMDLIAPDLTLKELNNLDDQAFRDGKLIPNNTQVRLLVFIQKQTLADAIGEIVPRIKAANVVDCPPNRDGYKNVPGVVGKCYPAWEDSLKQCIKKLDCNPLVVKMALGRMIIVGDEIEYIQRVVVDPSVTSQEVSVPKGLQLPPPTLQSIVVSDVTVAQGEPRTLKASGVYSDKTTKDLAEGTIKWTSSDPTVAKIDPDSGVVTTVKPGKSTITATPTEKGVPAKTATLTVTAPAVPSLKEIVVLAASVAQGKPLTFKASGRYSDETTKELPTGAVTWTSSDRRVATIDPSSGAVTALKPGTTTITATPTQPGVSAASAILTVTAPSTL
jgi:hypothetical protein